MTRQEFQPSVSLNQHIVLFSTGAKAFRNAYFGAGVGPIHLESVNCHGNEGSINECPRSPTVACDGHSQDVGVRCQGMLSHFPTVLQKKSHG